MMKKLLTLNWLALVITILPLTIQAQTVIHQAPIPHGQTVPATDLRQQQPFGVSGNASDLRTSNQSPGAIQWPQGGYTQQNNPYYDGSSPGGMVSDTVDWIMALPSNLFDRFSEFMDTRVFPNKPATSGPGVPQNVNDASAQTPLPPASAYNPSGR